MALVLIATEMKNLHGEIQELKHYCVLTSFWNPRYLTTGCASGSEVICSLEEVGRGEDTHILGTAQWSLS